MSRAPHGHSLFMTSSFPKRAKFSVTMNTQFDLKPRDHLRLCHGFVPLLNRYTYTWVLCPVKPSLLLQEVQVYCELASWRSPSTRSFSRISTLYIISVVSLMPESVKCSRATGECVRWTAFFSRCALRIRSLARRCMGNASKRSMSIGMIAFIRSLHNHNNITISSTH